MALTKVTGQVINTSTDVTVGVLTVTNTLAVGGTVSIGGTLTYEDVTNIDSVGLVTARDGIFIPDNKKIKLGDPSTPDLEIFHDSSHSIIKDAGTGTLKLLTSTLSVKNVNDNKTCATFSPASAVNLFFNGTSKLETTNTGAVVSGILTATSVAASGVDLTGLLKEDVKITAGKLSDNTNIDLENGMVHYFTTQETTTSTPNIRFSSSETLNSKMSIGESISVTIITTAAAGGYSAQLTIDGGAVTENWVGGSAPSDGGSSGVDIHAYTIIKTANATFTVIGNQSKTS